MSSSQIHKHDSPDPAGKKVRLLLAMLLVPLIVLTAVGTALLWPENRKHPTPEGLGAPAELVNGTIGLVTHAPCEDGSGMTCQTASVRLTSGPDKDKTITLTLQEGPAQPKFDVNDRIVVGRATDPTGQVAYYFSDYQRQKPLFALGLLFALLVVFVGRWRGVGAIIGLLATMLVVTQFILPAILEGKSPIWVAMVGGSIIVFVALYVAHGLNARTTTALIGTLLSLAVCCALAVISVKLSRLTGLSSEDATYVQTYAGNVNLQGLLLGGIIIGSLGVLNDMTITQSSAVWEIHRAQPHQSRFAIYTGGMRVGRDHIASTVYTLALAYVGAALPLLILFSIANRQALDVVGSAVVAEEIVRTLVGSIGLILSVPLTTGLAAMVVHSQPPRREAEPQYGPPDPVAPAIELEFEEPKALPAATSDGSTKRDDKPRFGLRKKVPTFDRHMTRRERKFWEED